MAGERFASRRVMDGPLRAGRGSRDFRRHRSAAGEPLITLELEAGTHRLVWNQSVTRTRWLAVKLGLIGLAAITAAGLGSLAVTWWSGPIDRTAGGFPRMAPVLFNARGIVPIGYAATPSRSA
jgi:hypothetical protein